MPRMWTGRLVSVTAVHVRGSERRGGRGKRGTRGEEGGTQRERCPLSLYGRRFPLGRTTPSATSPGSTRSSATSHANHASTSPIAQESTWACGEVEDAGRTVGGGIFRVEGDAWMRYDRGEGGRSRNTRMRLPGILVANTSNGMGLNMSQQISHTGHAAGLGQGLANLRPRVPPSEKRRGEGFREKWFTSVESTGSVICRNPIRLTPWRQKPSPLFGHAK